MVYGHGARPWRARYRHHSIFIFVLCAAHVVGTRVIDEVGCFDLHYPPSNV